MLYLFILSMIVISNLPKENLNEEVETKKYKMEIEYPNISNEIVLDETKNIYKIKKA